MCPDIVKCPQGAKVPPVASHPLELSAVLHTLPHWVLTVILQGKWFSHFQLEE